jgi:hypothetical protein
MHAGLDAQRGPLVGHILRLRRTGQQHSKKHHRYYPHEIFPQPNHPLHRRKTPLPFTIPDNAAGVSGVTANRGQEFFTRYRFLYFQAISRTITVATGFSAPGTELLLRLLRASLYG